MTTDRRLRVSAISFLLVCLSLFLTAYSARNPRVATFGTAALTEVQKPVQTFIGRIVQSVSDFWNSYLNLLGLRERFVELQKKYENLERDKATLLELQRENDRLRSLLSVAEVLSTTPVVARVLAYDPSNWVQSITVNRGSGDGVQIGMAAMTSEGIVGQVTAVGLTSAKILLITDHSSGVDAVIQDSRARGIVEGAGRKNLRWRFVLEDEEIKPGERLV
ncbi:MAG: rod shape-determining protein MreC, partial [Proteobacteria bacterium]|nr:rod shape-determining protein MreC [Pseudomonadota bacterium]